MNKWLFFLALPLVAACTPDPTIEPGQCDNALSAEESAAGFPSRRVNSKNSYSRRIITVHAEAPDYFVG